MYKRKNDRMGHTLEYFLQLGIWLDYSIQITISELDFFANPFTKQMIENVENLSSSL